MSEKRQIGNSKTEKLTKPYGFENISYKLK